MACANRRPTNSNSDRLSSARVSCDAYCAVERSCSLPTAAKLDEDVIGVVAAVPVDEEVAPPPLPVLVLVPLDAVPGDVASAVLCFFDADEGSVVDVAPTSWS